MANEENQNNDIINNDIINEVLNDGDSKNSSPSDVSSELKLPYTIRFSGKALRFATFLNILLTIIYIALFIWYFKFFNGILVPWALYSLMLGVPVLYWLIFWFQFLYKKYSLCYVLEQKKLKRTKGVIFYQYDVTMIAQIEDVTSKQSFIDALINGGTGTLILRTTDPSDKEESNASKGIIVIKGVEDIQKVDALFSDLISDYQKTKAIGSANN